MVNMYPVKNCLNMDVFEKTRFLSKRTLKNLETTKRDSN
jgi:hypothetical protein